MKKHVLMLTSCAFILASGAVGAGAEEGSDFHGRESHAMMGQEGGMGCGMMGRGMMHGGGMMGRGVAMRFIFALMDSDGDGTVSLQVSGSGRRLLVLCTRGPTVGSSD